LREINPVHLNRANTLLWVSPARVGPWRASLAHGGKFVNGSVSPQPNDPDWIRLLDAEAKLEAEIAAEEAAARSRVAAARAAAAAAVPDPEALAALSAAREQAANELLRSELVRIAAEAEGSVRALRAAPDSLIEALAHRALDAVLVEELLAEQR
jgi:hypothetical protein